MTTYGERRACERKIHYLTKTAAKKAMAKLKNKGRRLRPFRCAVCDGYHLRTKGMKRKARIR